MKNMRKGVPNFYSTSKSNKDIKKISIIPYWREIRGNRGTKERRAWGRWQRIIVDLWVVLIIKEKF